VISSGPPPLDPFPLEQALAARAGAYAWGWFERSREAVRREPTAIAALFPAVGRCMGRASLHSDAGAGRIPAGAGGIYAGAAGGAVAGDAHVTAGAGDIHAWTVDAAARTLLLVALGPAADGQLTPLYRHGDTAERCGALRALAYVPVADSVGVPLVEDALRTNDPRLVAAALGPYALARLDDAAIGQAVLKCLFVGVPLAGVAGLGERASLELAALLARYVDERVAAGRAVPEEVWPLLLAGTEILADSGIPAGGACLPASLDGAAARVES
jgi:hypothetical protein